jgi:TRAP-type C4-dicarboxylate transport system permease small subunit
MAAIDTIHKVNNQKIQYHANTSVAKGKLIGGGIALVVILAIGAIVAAYFVMPSFHNFINNTFTHIQNNQISVGQGLLYIALPIVGAYCIIRFCKKHKERMSNDLDLYSDDTLRGLVNTLRSFMPTRKQLIIGAKVLALLTLLAIGGCHLFHFVPATQQWATQAFTHKLHIWEAIAYIGGGTANAALLTHFIRKKIGKKDEIEESTGYQRPRWTYNCAAGDL